MSIHQIDFVRREDKGWESAGTAVRDNRAANTQPGFAGYEGTSIEVCRVCGVARRSRRDRHKQIFGFHVLPRRNKQFGDAARDGRINVRLHLHRFQRH